MVRSPTWMIRKRVPLADRLVGQDQGVLAGRAGAVVPEPARALVGPHAGVARLGEVPDLDLRVAAEIDAAIPLGADLEIDLQLDVAVVLVGGEVGALAVVDDHAVLDPPVLLQVLGALLEGLGLLVGAHRRELARVHGLHAVPAGEVLAVEEGHEVPAAGRIRAAPAPARRPSPRPRPTPATRMMQSRLCMMSYSRVVMGCVDSDSGAVRCPAPDIATIIGGAGAGSTPRT